MNCLNFLLNDKKSAQNVWFYDLEHKKSIWLSSRTLFRYLLMPCRGQEIHIQQNNTKFEIK